MIDYTWEDWLVELATKIATNDEAYLAECARAVAWQRENIPLLAYGDENIDPMSFLYFLAQRNTAGLFDGIFGSVHEVFGIAVDFPRISALYPRPATERQGVVPRREFIPTGVALALFRQAAPNQERPVIEPEDFDGVLNLPNVGMAKLTQTLFIANPRHYLPAFSPDKWTLPHHPELKGEVKSYEDYLHQMEALRRLFPGCEPYEINIFLDTQSKNPLISKETDFFQISTNAYNDDTDYWKQIGSLEENYLFNENHYVYTGGAGRKREYPLREPKRGDIVLVRHRPWQGRAIAWWQRMDTIPMDGTKKGSSMSTG